ncbi:xylose isomerase isoform X1 [Bombyx mori]|uniref:Xylose isomerase n=1 Tax=Bombyx mori TaxID=7091 RepID=A0A8R2HM04_BOMMO|nr:xylose isomerase isoform X1 [Bombyx mori]
MTNVKMSSYSQPGAKRQKLRTEHVDYFQAIDKIQYNNMAAASDTASYRYYNSAERIHSKTMEEWLKYSVSFSEFRNNGSDAHGRPTLSRQWDDNTDSVENHKRCVKALFDFCVKTGIKYWTAFDSDLIPHSDNIEENKTYFDEMVECVQECSQRSHVKLLWIAPDLHSHPRYTSGAFTSNDAATFAHAATQIKRCLEMSQRMNAECFLLWPYREGYDNVYHADVGREIKLFAKLMKITAEYKDRLNYRCQLLMMPYYNSNMHTNDGCTYHSWQHRQWRETEMINMYMWDVTSCLYFLKHYNLDRYYKVCSPPGHHMYMANVYNMLGGVFVTNAVDQCDSRRLTLMMKLIVEQGTPLPGGINLKLSPRRDGDLRDYVTTYVKYVDAMARALRFACSLISEQILSKHLQQRYTSYYSGFGSRLVSSDVSMEECEEYLKKSQGSRGDAPPSQGEHLELTLQRYLDTCDRI